MKNPSQEDLLGYVLGALDADQHHDLQNQIDSEPQLEEQLLDIKSSLTPLELLDETSGIRPGLARRTCEMVASFRIGADSTEVSISEPSRSERLFSKAPWSLVDVLTAAASIGILASLLFPVLSYTKYQSQIADCGNNLRSLGMALASYSEFNEGRFPEIPSTGPLAFSGVVAPILKDQHFIEDDSWFRCIAVKRDEPLMIPSSDQITQCAAGPQYDRYRQTATGDYGSSFGHVENGAYYPPCVRGCKNRILFADKPSAGLVSGPSDNHGGNGQNCLFEDLHVKYVSGCSHGEDCIYVNAYNIVGPGVGSRDSVIGASHLSPLGSQQPGLRNLK